MEITRENYAQIASDLKLSYAVLKRLAHIRPEILLGGDACFYDIETEKNRFKLGVVNDKVFNEPKEMLSEIQKFRVACGFNSYRFDNEILFHECPGFFRTVDYHHFVLHKIEGCINVDMLPVFMLFSPFKVHHRLDDLASALGIERRFKEFTEEKCREDVQIIQRFYPVCVELLNWLEQHFLLDPETVCVLYYRDFVKLRRWLLQSWMLQHGIYPKLMRVEDERKPSYFRMFKKGFFRNINVFDIKSSYPTTVVKLNCSIYEPGDFAGFEKFMLQEREKYRVCSKCGCAIE